MSSSANKMASVGVIAAIASSLCCIVPAVAAIAGVSGVGSAFSWMDPFRPYLIGLTVLALGFAWYQVLKPMKADDCGCEVPQKSTFFKSKGFLAIMTVFAGLALGFPYYQGFFSNSTPVTVAENNNSDTLQVMQMKIEGMTCTGCENHVSSALLSHEGVFEAEASYTDSTALVKFNPLRIDQSTLQKGVEDETGYKVLEISPVESK